ncbi:MAG: LysR family transcriptional regulator [Ramlibacter sp.]|nr:LysR family transcriptional regulator [Ramlibacter sp.]
MDIRALKCFIWTAELGNITRASAELGIVQSALSRKLQNIEQELGAALFVRLPRGIQLTPAGQQFLGRARRILRELESARSEISNQAAVEGAVTLGLSPTLAPIIAPGCLEQVHRDFPDVALKVVEGFSSVMLEPLLSGRIDVAVLTNPPRVSGLRLEPAVSEEVVVVTAPGVRGIQPFYTLDELCRTPLLVTSGFRTVVDDQLRKLGKQLAAGTEIDSVEAIRRIVARGRGVTVMPVSTYQEDIRAGRLDAFHIADANLHRLLVIAMPPENRTSPAMQKIVEVLGRQFSALADEGIFSLLPRTSVPIAEPRG